MSPRAAIGLSRGCGLRRCLLASPASLSSPCMLSFSGRCGVSSPFSHTDSDCLREALCVDVTAMAPLRLLPWLQLFLFAGLSKEDGQLVISAQDCTLDCVIKGDPKCEFCRISQEDIELTLGIKTDKIFGSCVPWPCHFLMGLDSPSLCQHFVGAPRDVTVEFVYSQDPGYDTVVVSWRPSQYGISFLRGFQVSVQALGGMLVGCQLLLFQRNLSLEAVDAEKVYQSDPFPALALGSQYVATVMALPVPEQWEKYQQEEKYQQSKQFSTQTCTKKRVLAKCRRDWYPTDIAVEQEGADVIVTFNLAPPSLGINGYFSYCYGAGTRNYTEFKVNPSENQTHHSFRLAGLRGGVNYSCGIAADQVDPVHKGFTFHMKPPPQEPPPPGPNLESVILVLLLFVTVLLALVAVGFLLFLKKWKEGRRKRAEMQAPAPCNYKEAPREGPSTQPRPPRLLLCYSNRDGPAHIGVVMRLAAFLQQHMSTQVHLDLWEGLSLVEEGPMGWYTRRMQESDFVLAVCSRGLCQLLDKRAQHHREKEEEEEEESWDGDVSAAAVSLIGEEMGWAASRGQDLSKYMAAIFEYSRETDFPGLLGLASRYVLPQDLPLLFSHLHGVALHGPGRQLLVENVSGEGYLSVPAGAALSRAITEAKGAGEDEGRLGGEEEALL